MRAVVVYESMFGNTHVVADHIARGLRASSDDVVVVPVAEATPELITGADLVVVGGPTHMHGMSSEKSRKSAKDRADEDDDLDLDPDAEGPGLSDWFDAMPDGSGRSGIAFDTRVEGPPLLTGRAGKGISRRLKRHGYHLVAEPESFLVDKANQLLDGEADRAAQWGETLTP